MRNVVRAIVIAVALPVLAAAYDEPTGFQRVPFGADEKRITTEYPAARCVDSTDRRIADRV
jgi:hypothetical protein